MAYREINVAVAFKWDGTNWTDETANFMSASGALELVPPAEAFQSSRQTIQQCQVVMANKALRYSIENTSSAIYAYISGGQIYQTPCRIQVMTDTVNWENVFTGYIKLPQYDYVRNTATFTVWDIGEILKQKFSTIMLKDYLEHEVVVYYLELAGLVDGTDFISPEWEDANPGDVATIEYSTTPIPFSWLDDEPVWSELVDLAQASGSRVYIDRAGLVHYEKAGLWALGYIYTPETIALMAAFTPEYDDKAFFDAIMVEYTERVPGPSNEELWKLTKPKVIQPGKVENIIARFKYPAITVDTPVANDTYYLTDIAGVDVTGSVTITLSPTYAQQATITINNTLGYAIVLAQASITGQGIHGQPTEQHLKEIDTPVYGRRVDIRGNPYLQSRLQAETVAEFIGWWYEELKAVYKVTNIPGLPSRQLGLRVELAWVDSVNHVSRTVIGIIIRVDWQISILKNGGILYSQNLTLLEDAFGVEDYFIIGTSTLAGTDVLWY
jgi:hypothetical protein